MVDATRQEAWQHTAWLSSLIANANRDAKKHPKPFTPQDFNPMLTAKSKTRGGILVTEKNVGDLRAVFEPLKRKDNP